MMISDNTTSVIWHLVIEKLIQARMQTFVQKLIRLLQIQRQKNTRTNTWEQKFIHKNPYTNKADKETEIRQYMYSYNNKYLVDLYRSSRYATSENFKLKADNGDDNYSKRYKSKGGPTACRAKCFVWKFPQDKQ